LFYVRSETNLPAELIPQVTTIEYALPRQVAGGRQLRSHRIATAFPDLRACERRVLMRCSPFRLVRRARHANAAGPPVFLLLVDTSMLEKELQGRYRPASHIGDGPC
jgi:hypothetical protein